MHNGMIAAESISITSTYGKRNNACERPDGPLGAGAFAEATDPKTASTNDVMHTQDRRCGIHGHIGYAKQAF